MIIKRPLFLKFLVRFINTCDKLQTIEIESLLRQKEDDVEIIYTKGRDYFCFVNVKFIETIDYLLERAIFVKSASFCDYLYFNDFVEIYKLDKSQITVRLLVKTIVTQISFQERNDFSMEGMKYIKNYKIKLFEPDYFYQILIYKKEKYNTIYYKDSLRKHFLKYDIKYRPFIGITCMNWEISIFMANICAVDKDSLVLEPYLGCGGIAMACLIFDANIIGIEKDKKMLYGQKERKGNVKTSMKGYKIHDNFNFINKRSNVVAIINTDSFTINMRFKFDAIICDPPYGDRISLGRKNQFDFIKCLRRLADKNLKDGGRLCFFFPTQYDLKIREIFVDFRFIISVEQILRSVTRTLYLFTK